MPKMDSETQRLQRIIILAVLIAMGILLRRFGLNDKMLELNVTFVVLFLIGLWYNWLWTGMACLIGNTLATLFAGEALIPIFWVPAILSGLVMSWFFYHQQVTWLRVILSQLIIALVCNLGLTTLCISWTNHLPFGMLLMIRVWKELLATPLQILVIHWLGNRPALITLTRQYF